MPYKLVGKAVYKKEGKKLTLIKKHPSHQKALAHFRALEINVSQKGLESTMEKSLNLEVLQDWAVDSISLSWKAYNARRRGMGRRKARKQKTSFADGFTYAQSKVRNYNRAKAIAGYL